MCVILGATDMLQWRDHAVDHQGDPQQIPQEHVGSVKGKYYLTQMVLRPMSIQEIMAFAQRQAGAG